MQIDRFCRVHRLTLTVLDRIMNLTQREIPLAPAPMRGPESLIPVRMINEWTYCPRLAYLEWVENEWAENADTVEGRKVHARVDKGEGRLPDPEDVNADINQARAVTLSSDRLGIIAKMDVVEIENGAVMPIDFKKSKRPHVSSGAYEPERVQVCAQAMILEDNGYKVERGTLWYAGSRERVPVVLNEELRATTLRAIAGLRAAADSKQRPPPLENSSKCPRCSLAGICLPDETNLFRKGYVPRPLNPADDPALPLYVQTPGALVRKSGEQLIVETREKDKVNVPLIDVSQVSLFGPTSVTTPAMHALLRENIPVSWFSSGGWFLGYAVGTTNTNIFVREAQYRSSFDERRCLALAKDLVAAKVRNSRTILRRNWRGPKAVREEILGRLKHITRQIPRATDVQKLLGTEGEAAAAYFSNFQNLIASDSAGSIPKFSFTTRNRRPPTDPVNAMLSLAYALLTREFTTVILLTGLDPHMGFYHRPRSRRPALALDLMEPYRPLIADSCVLQVVNNGEVKLSNFVFNGPACALNSTGRRSFIAAFERRMQQETTHPVFGYRVSMRRLIDVQMRLFARYLQGETSTYSQALRRF